MFHVDINSYGKQQCTLFHPMRLWEQIHIRQNNIDCDSGTKKDTLPAQDVHFMYVIEYKAALNHTSCQLAAMEELLPR